jgi:hypothetical protein
VFVFRTDVAAEPIPVGIWQTLEGAMRIHLDQHSAGIQTMGAAEQAINEGQGNLKDETYFPGALQTSEAITPAFLPFVQAFKAWNAGYRS